MKSTGTNEKALASQQKAQESNKKNIFYCYEKHRSKQVRIRSIVRSTRTNQKTLYSYWLSHSNHRNQRKTSCFIVKSIGINEKAMVLMRKHKSIGAHAKALALLRKVQEPTKKHWFECEKHRNQRKSIGFTVKNKRTNNKTYVFTTENIGTNEKALVSS